jgi:protoporphyrinogen oxidase
MVWFWGKIWLRTTSRRSPLDQEKLGYFEGSFQVMVDALVNACEKAGVTIVRAGTSALEPLPYGKWSIVQEEGGERVEVDAALATVPSHIFQRLAPPMPEVYREKLEALTYEAAVVAILELDQPLSDIYWLNIADSELPFTGVIEHTNFVSPDHYQGRRFVYLSTYLEPDHRYFTLSEDALLDEYLPYLKRINPAFERIWVRNSWVFRERAAQPIIPMRYSEKIPSLRTPLPNLYLANTTQIYPEDRGTNYSVRLGEDVSRLIIDDLGGSGA